MKKNKYDRQKKKLSRIYGINGCREILTNPRQQILGIDIMEDAPIIRMPLFTSIQKNYSHLIRILGKDKYLQKYHGMRTQGIVLYIPSYQARNKLPDFKDSRGNIFLLFADNIEDPQNLGQIIRSAECAGIDGLVIPKHHSAQITDSVLQVSQGAFLYLPIYVVSNLRNTIVELKKQGFWSVALENSVKSKLWHEIDFTGKIACVVGSEGKGIRPLILKSCDFLATIPMKGRINSLNVSAAVSTILFERNRQVYSPGDNS